MDVAQLIYMEDNSWYCFALNLLLINIFASRKISFSQAFLASAMSWYEIILHYRLVPHVYSWQHESFFLFLLLFFGGHAGLHISGQDFLSLHSKLFQFSIGANCSHQQGNGLLIFLELNFERVILLLNFLNLLQRKFTLKLLFLKTISIPDHTAHDRLLFS